MNWLYPFVSVFIVSAISFIGLWTFAIGSKQLHKLILYLVSFSAGGLLGDAFIHLLPDAADGGFNLQVSLIILLGIFLSFIIEKIIWRHCHVHHCHAKHHHARPQPFAYLNLIGDGVHNFIDGLIIGGSYLVSASVGITTTLAVVLHEIPQELGDFGVLIHGGFSPWRALFFNFLSGLAAVFGTFVALFLHTTTNIETFLIPFAAGNFIYIACTDLLPELHKSTHGWESVKQIIAFVLGTGVMVLLLVLLE
ncbi:MAG TPA: ZIP family metal transporter [Candidatus Nanoarchaeia archaeon]|nr:ZIP family metal transporter [Candidatus Nanoarchaeia archaeon]